MQNSNDYISYLESEDKKSSKRRLMWVAVIGLTVIIAGLWGWSLRLQMAFFEWRNTPEGALVENTKTDWDEAFNNKQTEQSKFAESKAAVKNVLAGLLSRSAEASIASNSTSATSTVSSITSTSSTN